MSKPTLEDRKKTIQGEIDGRVKAFNKTTDQRNTLNRQLSQLRDELTHYQGQMTLINGMIKERDDSGSKDKKKK